MTLSDQIRAAISRDHQLIESTPLAVSMVCGTVPRLAYGRLLWRLLAIHRELEEALGRHQHIADLCGGYTARSGALERDLRLLSPGASFETEPADSSLTSSIRRWTEAAPASLLGCLYVLEGSRMGSHVLAPRLAQAFGVPCEKGNGLDYHLEGSGRTAEYWRQLKARLDEAQLHAAEARQAVKGARRTMTGLLEVFQSLSAETPSLASPA